MSVSTGLAEALVKQLGDVRAKKGDKITLEDIGAMLEHVVGTQNAGTGHIQNELQAIVARLDETRADMQSMLPGLNGSEGAASASTQLDEVVKSTEDAANTIMDAAETIQNASRSIEGEAGQAIQAEVTKIFEACSFQDLTGQRIGKVLATLAYVEEHVRNITDLFGGEAALEKKSDGEISLLDGPQASGSAPTQADIDALFNSLD